MNGFIYIIVTPTDKIYIGQTNDLKRRFREYKSISNCKNQTLLKNAIKKYSFERCYFGVLETTTIENLSEREIYWIEVLKCNLKKYPNNNGLNLTSGGVAGSRGCMVGDNRKENQRKLMIGNTFRAKGSTPHNKGIPRSMEERLKISDAVRKALNSQNTEPMKDTLTKKTKEERAYITSQSTGRLILDTITGIYYIGLTEASKAKGINRNTLKGQLANRWKNRSLLTYV